MTPSSPHTETGNDTGIESDTHTETTTIDASQPAQTGMTSPTTATQEALDDSDLLEKKEPGVYVRNRRAADELDYLWGKEKQKERDPSRFLSFYFMAGILIGALIGISSTLFMVYKTEWMPANRAVVTPGGPIIEEQLGSGEAAAQSGGLLTTEELVTKAEETQNNLDKPENFVTIIQDEVKANNAPKPTAPKPTAKPSAAQSPSSATTTSTSASATMDVKIHTIKSGDTLGAIAAKYYDSVDPKYIDKLQRANNIKNAGALKLGQKITIPPKSY